MTAAGVGYSKAEAEREPSVGVRNCYHQTTSVSGRDAMCEEEEEVEGDRRKDSLER